MDDTRLEEIAARLEVARESIEDPEVRSRYARMALADVGDLVEAVREAKRVDGGGDLGLLLRDALRDRIDAHPAALSGEERRIAKLSDDVHVHSLALTAVKGQGRVVVDVRLMVGDKPVLT